MTRWSSARASRACTCSTGCATPGFSARVLRGRRRRRRHLVLEPVPGRALRRREPRVLVLVLRRSLQQEWEWTERFATQPEILRYLNHVADRFDLRRTSSSNATVTAARYDDDGARLAVSTTADGDGRTAPLRASWPPAACRPPAGARRSRASIPIAGARYHTGDWPHEGVDFTGQRVGVIGTGSSGVQVIPLIARAGGRARTSSSARRTSPCRRATQPLSAPTRSTYFKDNYPRSCGQRARASRERHAAHEPRRVRRWRRRRRMRQQRFEARLARAAAATSSARSTTCPVDQRGQRHRWPTSCAARSARSSATRRSPRR